MHKQYMNIRRAILGPDQRSFDVQIIKLKLVK